jgi:gliding motility-associated-like protein
MYSYKWTLDERDVGSDQYFNATEAGKYIAEYTDINCCTNRDTLEVIPLNIKLPTAFIFDGTSPEEVNRRFKTLGPTEGIEDFTLVVYNRWGQLVWETRNSADFWDGTFQGEPAPAGLYAWNMTFNVTGNVTDIGKVTYRGVVTLLRK